MGKRTEVEKAFLDGWSRALHWQQQITAGTIHDEDADAEHTRGSRSSVAERAFQKWLEEGKARGQKVQ